MQKITPYLILFIFFLSHLSYGFSENLSQASLLILQHDHELAEKKLQDVIKAGPNEDDRFQASLLLTLLNKPAQAEQILAQHFVENIEKKFDRESQETIYKTLALRLFDESKFDLAKNAFEKIKSEKYRDFAQYYLGLIDMNQNNPKSTFERWHKIIMTQNSSSLWRALILNSPLYFSLADTFIFKYKDTQKKILFLSQVYGSPSLASNFKNPRPLLWFLEVLLNSTQNDKTLNSWALPFLDTELLSEKLALPIEEQFKVFIKLSSQIKNWEFLIKKQAFFERELSTSSTILQTYQTGLEKIIEEYFKSPFTVPGLKSAPLAMTYFESAKSILSDLIDLKSDFFIQLDSKKIDLQKTPYLFSLLKLKQGLETHHRASQIVLDKNNLDLFADLQKKISLIKTSMSFFLLASKTFPPLGTTISSLIKNNSEQLRVEISHLEFPPEFAHQKITILDHIAQWYKMGSKNEV